MSKLSTLLPASGTSNFVASGILPNGIPVALKADGTIEAVNTVLPESIPAGSLAVYNAIGQTNDNKIAFDPNNASQFVVIYKDYGTTGVPLKAIVGTVSGTTITFGTPVVFNSGNSTYPSISFDPNTSGKFVIAYKDGGNSNYGTAIVGTVSGTSITFGTPVVFNSGTTYHVYGSFDPNTAGKFVVVYKDAGNSNYGTAVVGTVSGTTITFGTPVVFNSGNSDYDKISFDPNTAGKFVVAYRDGGNANKGTAIVGTVSGTSVSFGTPVVYSTATVYNIEISFDPNTAGKFVVIFKQGNPGFAVVGTVSGTSIVFGSPVEYRWHILDNSNSISFDPNTAGKFVIVSDNSSGAEFTVGTISGTSISFGTPVEIIHSINYPSIAFTPNDVGKFVYVYADAANSYYGTAVVCQLEAIGLDPTNLTETNFIGTSNSTYADGETASVMLQGGITTNQTGLTAGSTYYVQPDGTLATSAGTPSVVAGKALSATSLFLSDTPVASGGGGAWEVISSQTVTSTGIGSIEFTGIDATYSTHVVVFDVGTATDIQWHIRYGSTAGYPATATDYYVVWNRAGSSSGSGQYTTTGQGILTALSNSEASGTCTIHGLGASGTLRHYGSSYTKRVNNQNWIDATGGAYLNSTNVALSKLYIFPWDNLDIAVGSTVTLYGIKTS